MSNGSGPYQLFLASAVGPTAGEQAKAMLGCTEADTHRGNLVWLCIYCASGVALQMCVELLIIHSGPAKQMTFFMVFVGYWGQFLMAGLWIACRRSHRCGMWTNSALGALVACSVCDAAGSCFDSVAQLQGGPMLYAVFHSSIIVFASLVAVALLRARLTALQWAGTATVVLGLLVTAIPSQVEARGSFAVGLASCLVGSLLHALFLPLGEMASAPPLCAAGPPGEVLALWESLLGVAAFSAWTAGYTAPRWREAVLAPIFGPRVEEPSVAWTWVAYLFYGVAVGTHSVAFFKTVRRVGTVPTAVSKGVQQVGVVLCAHLFFCGVDHTQCLNYNHGNATVWSRLQKVVAVAVCSFGVLIYTLGRSRERPGLDHTCPPTFDA